MDQLRDRRPVAGVDRCEERACQPVRRLTLPGWRFELLRLAVSRVERAAFHACLRCAGLTGTVPDWLPARGLADCP
jgi:hypothetical protein